MKKSKKYKKCKHVLARIGTYPCISRNTCQYVPIRAMFCTETFLHTPTWPATRPTGRYTWGSARRGQITGLSYCNGTFNRCLVRWWWRRDSIAHQPASRRYSMPYPPQQLL